MPRRAQIEAAINAGVTIIVDRYYWSGVVYTAAKRNPSLTRAWSRNCDVGLPTPDICFFLNISAEAARIRGGGYGEERYEKEEFQSAVRTNFEMLFLFEGWERVCRIDAGRSADEVDGEMRNAISDLYGKLERGELAESLSKVLSNEILEQRNRDKELEQKDGDKEVTKP
jgi:dTMP kinase